MDSCVNKKSVLIKQLVLRMLLQSLAFFVLSTVFQTLVYIQNIHKTSSPLPLVVLLAALAVWCLSYFEIRTLTFEDNRFLGYKAYILFFYKLFMFPLGFVTMLIASILSAPVWLLVLLMGVWVMTYYVLFVIFIKKYIALFSSNTTLYISYQVRVKNGIMRVRS